MNCTAHTTAPDYCQGHACAPWAEPGELAAWQDPRIACLASQANLGRRRPYPRGCLACSMDSETRALMLIDLRDGHSRIDPDELSCDCGPDEAFEAMHCAPPLF